jgi:uncharacterized protein (DUF488 family)
MIQFFTIGVYEKTPEEFFGELTKNKIDMFIDIRRVRGVRGPAFSFVNSERLQRKLSELGINYLHILELSPTREIRDLQKAEDKKRGIATRKRNELSEDFKKEYREQILQQYDLTALVRQLEECKTKSVVLFCVENHAHACHRSLVSEKLAHDFGFKVVHL